LIRVVIISILFASCSNKNSSDSNSGERSVDNSILPKSMIGKWRMNVTISDGLRSVCNFCAAIFFERGKKARIISATKEYQLNWEFRAPDTLRLNLLNEETLRLLTCEQLVFKVELNKDSTTMQLTAINGSCIYLLDRGAKSHIE
jgi:hypothetical protein